MSTALQSALPQSVPPKLTASAEDEKPLHLKTWREAGEYFKKHLTPVRFGPKGQPIYSGADIDALNVILPEELD